MAIFSTIKRRFEEVEKELSDELTESYKVRLRLHLSLTNDSGEQYIAVTIVEYDTWNVNSISVDIDTNASLTDTLTHVKNKFRATSKFDQYRKPIKYTVREMLIRLTFEDNMVVWFCKRNSSLCSKTELGTLQFYRLNGEADYTEDEYNKIRTELMRTTPVAFTINERYEEFKDYLRTFYNEIQIYEDDVDNALDEGDTFHFPVKRGIGSLSELDIKSFELLSDFERWLKLRKVVYRLNGKEKK